MKIGILTFHWATNYGAILQAWCLQEYLISLGHNVEIINYKPHQFDFSWFRIFRHPSLWKTIPSQLSNRKKEYLLVPFRKLHLKETRRYTSVDEFKNDLDQYDILISGSDQVLNPGFTISGDNGKPSPVYWLGVGRAEIIKIGYAVSFGYEVYPEAASIYAKEWVKSFDAIGTREISGLNILKKLDYTGYSCILPDPTILQLNNIFKLVNRDIRQETIKYTCVYMLRREIKLDFQDIIYIDEKHNPLRMEEWISTIINAKQLVTNSYHGMVMALIAHVPFVVLLEEGRGKGMNDRFYTLLTRLNLSERATTSLGHVKVILSRKIDFCKVDRDLFEYRELGVNFLNEFVKIK